jgi:uncharacterized protein (DUF1800 family)
MKLGRSVSHQLHRFALPLLACTIAVPSVSLAQTTFPTGWESTTSTSLRAAGRILNQTTFGPTDNAVYNVEAIGIPAYVAQQLNEPAYQMESIIPQASYGSGDCNGWACDPEAYWWQDILFGQDQLRQRVAFALSKLFVVSYSEVDPRYYPYYLNKLSADAFGNWFQLMQDVTLSPAMGTYLDMADSLYTPGAHADENFAREFMQLFSIGTIALNQDGTPKLSGGNTIPNYTPAIVQSFAQAYTGYTFANNDCSTPSTPNYYWAQPPGQSCPMVPLSQYHNTAQKILLRGQVLPAGQTAAQDLNAALTNVFDDPSLPPFVCTRLIQNLVKSNPSPAYVSRIAGVFINDGTGVRGNLKAVISAILLDPEARADDTPGTSNPLTSTPTTGMMRDPVLWWASILRGLGAQQTMAWPYDGIYLNIFDLWLTDLGEAPHEEPSVFSFYSPTNTLPGTTLYAPELQLENPYSISWMIDHVQDMLDSNFYLNNPNEFTLNVTATSGLGQIASSEGPTGLVDALSALFMHGTMTTDMRDSIVQAVQGLDPETMVKNAVFLVVSSPQYRIMI